MTKSKKLTNAEINAHPLLTADQRKLCKIFRDKSKRQRVPFSMLDFAVIRLRATAHDYAEMLEAGVATTATADAEHRHAAILYVYEKLKNGPKIITETIAARGTLRDLELLVSHGAA